MARPPILALFLTWGGSVGAHIMYIIILYRSLYIVEKTTKMAKSVKKRGLGKTKRNRKNQLKRQKQIEANVLVLKKLESEFKN